MLSEQFFLITLANINVGAFREAIGAIDIPTNKDIFGLPQIRGESIKGYYRSQVELKLSEESVIDVIFGSQEKAGSIIFNDASLIFIPTPTRYGVIYITAPILLNRLANILYQGNKRMRDLANFIEKIIRDSNKIGIGKALVYMENFKEKTIRFLGDVELNIIQKEELKTLKEIIDSALEKTVGSFLKSMNRGIVILTDEMYSLIGDRLLLSRPRLKLRGLTEGEVYQKVVETGPWFEEEIPKFSIFVSSLRVNRIETLAKNSETILKFLKKMREVKVILRKNCTMLQVNEDTIMSLLTSFSTFDLTVGSGETVGRGLIKVVSASNILKDIEIPNYNELEQQEENKIALPSINPERLAFKIFQDLSLKADADEIKGKVSSLPERISKFGFYAIKTFYNVLKAEASGKGYKKVKEILEEIEKILEREGFRTPHNNVEKIIITKLSRDIAIYLKYLVRSYAGGS